MVSFVSQLNIPVVEEKENVRDSHCHIWFRHSVTRWKKKGQKSSLKHKKIVITLLQYTHGYLWYRGTGTQCVTVCQKSILYPYLPYLF